jgi:hypothetical protein
MNTGNLVFLTVAFGLVVLAWQRTAPRQRWLTLLVLVLPVAFFSYRWARYREQMLELKAAAGAALALNALFWLLYGRGHPPGHQGEITVLGMEDMD